MKVLLIGGTFDPIHNGHLAIADYAKEFLSVDEVWFVPAKTPRWKTVQTPAVHRLKMLRLAIENKEHYKICDFELKKKGTGTSYTYDTLKHLVDHNKNIEFYFLVGTDQLDLLPKWHRIDELAKLTHLVTVKRPGYQVNKEIVKKYKVIEVTYEGPFVSSSMIRMLSSFDVPDSVKTYIRENGLYLANKLSLELSPTRYAHSLRVAKMAKKIAKANKIDVNKAYIAGLLHDCAKELPKDIAKKMMEAVFIQYIDLQPQLYHQFLGTIVAREVYHIKDTEILKAIMFHATASEDMSTLSKIVYAADKIEPGRSYDSSSLINACLLNIDDGFKKVLKENVKFLEKKTKKKVEGLTLQAYEKYVRGGK